MTRARQLAEASTTGQLSLIKVLIAGPSSGRRGQLRRTIDAEPGFVVVGEARDPKETLAVTLAARPDVILINNPPGPSARESVNAVLAASPGARVVVMTIDTEVQSVRGALDAGSAGYILEDARPRELVTALREVAEGARYIDPTLGAALIALDAAEQRRAAGEALSPREDEVLRLLVLGHTNREIAQLLSISVRTAESHRSHIMRKLGVSTRAELVRYSLERGMLGGGEE